MEGEPYGRLVFEVRVQSYLRTYIRMYVGKSVKYSILISIVSLSCYVLCRLCIVHCSIIHVSTSMSSIYVRSFSNQYVLKHARTSSVCVQERKESLKMASLFLIRTLSSTE